MPPSVQNDNHYVDHESLDPIEYEEIGEQSFNDQPTNNAPPHDSQSSTNQPKDAAPTFLGRLSQLPMQRSLPWREGQELPPERSTGSPRVQQRGACLLATRGNINDRPCDLCAAGLGRFTHCITLGNWFQGACSSCIFTSKGNRCSARLQRGKVDGRKARHQLAEDGGVVEEQRPKSTKKRKTWAPARDPAIVSIINKTLCQSPAQPTATTAASITRKTLDQSPAQPSAAKATPQTASPEIDSMLQAEIAREEPTGLLGYVHQMEKKQKRHHNTNVSREMSHDELPRYNGTSLLMQGSNNILKTAIVQSSPQNPTPPPQHDPYTQFPRKNPMAGGGARPQADGGQPVPLIDTFPKSKQRQIFALISGIQGGIDHLQRQLNLLQTSLGLEPEDSKIERAHIVTDVKSIA